MLKIQITEAKKIAERIGADQVVVIAFAEDHLAVTSYGATKRLCADAGRWIDQLVADLESGRLPTPSDASAARDRASGERGGAGGSPMPPRPAQSACKNKGGECACLKYCADAVPGTRVKDPVRTPEVPHAD